MNPYYLGKDQKTGRKLYLSPEMFRTHFHLVGATGSGKSTGILTMLRPILMQPGIEKCTLFLIDPMGNLSRDLLSWIADKRLCPQHIRDRLVYIEPAREEKSD